jgi:hypothetical protein
MSLLYELIHQSFSSSFPRVCFGLRPLVLTDFAPTR